MAPTFQNLFFTRGARKMRIGIVCGCALYALQLCRIARSGEVR